MTAHNEAVLDALHGAQELALELAEALEADYSAQGQRRLALARRLTSRLYGLESQLLETPDD